MYKEIKSLYINRGCFTNNGQPIELPGLLKRPLNILYGRNGSGKSTIARSLRDFSDSTTASVSFDTTIVNLNKFKEGIHVFDEDYIDKNIKFIDDGELSNIVMIGDQVTINEECEVIENNLKELNTKKDELVSKKESFEQTQTQTEATRREFLSSYKEDEKSALNESRAATHTIDEFRTYIDNNINISDQDVENSKRFIDEHKREVREGKDRKCVSWEIPTVSYDEDFFNSINDLIQINLADIAITDEFIKNIILTKPNIYRSTKEMIANTGLNRCPYCYQQISPEKLADIRLQISIAEDESEMEQKDKIKEVIAKVNDISLEVPELPEELYGAVILNYKNAVSEFNGCMQVVRDTLQERYDNVRTNNPNIIDVQIISDKINNFSLAATRMHEVVTEYQNKLNNYRDTRQKIKDNFKIIFFKRYEELIKSYFSNQKKINSLESQILQLEGDISEKEEQLATKRSSLGNVEIAVEEINHALRFIFGGENRLQLVAVPERGYKVQSRGGDVKTCDLSTGERNILALAYFFTHIAKGMEKASKYSNPMLLYIDDPITSFDYGNRMGVMAYLKSEIKAILENNDDSKVIVSSHEQNTIIDLTDSFYGVIGRRVSDLNGETDEEKKLKVFDLQNRKLTAGKESEYALLLKNIYDFTQTLDPDDIRYLGMGNQIRRALEGFSLCITGKTDIQSMVNNIWHSIYLPRQTYTHDNKIELNRALNSYLQKSFLNSSSHAYSDFTNMNQTYNNSEFQKLAKIALVLIYTVGSNLFYSYFKITHKDENNPIKVQVEQWRYRLANGYSLQE